MVETPILAVELPVKMVMMASPDAEVSAVVVVVEEVVTTTGLRQEELRAGPLVLVRAVRLLAPDTVDQGSPVVAGHLSLLPVMA